MRRQWTFLLYIALAATAMPALGQTIASESGPASGVTNGAASIPEFTGVWTHPAFPWFEPPAYGPGPVTNKSRWPQQHMDASGTIALPPLPPGRGRRERLRPAGRRLYQSNLAALGSGGREKVRRNVDSGHRLREPFQPMLAQANAVHLQTIRGANHSGAGQSSAHL